MRFVPDLCLILFRWRDSSPPPEPFSGLRLGWGGSLLEAGIKLRVRW